MKLSIIIPVFNEENTITQVIERVENLKLSQITKEIIIVDDGSTDRTQNIIKNSKFKNFKFIKHSKNQGKGTAVRTGIKNSTGDYIIIQDADLEYHPKYINALLKPVLNKNAEVVYGTRLNRMPHPRKEENKLLFFIHYFGNRFLSLITSILYGQWITDMETGYKLFPKKVVDSMKLSAKGFEFEPEITTKLLKKGYKILEISIITKPRGYNEGKKLNTIRDGANALWAILKYRYLD